MKTRKSKTRYRVLAGPAFLFVFFINACNNSGEKNKENPKDTTINKNADTLNNKIIPGKDTSVLEQNNPLDTSKGTQLYCVYKGEDSATYAPLSDIMLYANGTSVKIASISGEATNYEKDTFKDKGIPADAVSACGAWYAGGGDYFYLVIKNGKPVVYRGYQEEGDNTPGYHWQKITIK